MLRIMLWEGTLSLYCTPRSVQRFGMVYDISIILKAEEGTHRAMLWDVALRAEGKSRSVSLPIVRQPAEALGERYGECFRVMIIGMCIENRCTPEHEVRGQLRSVQ